MSVLTEKSSLRGAYPKIFCGRDTRPHFSIDTACGVLRPKFNGWSLIIESCRVIINTFAPKSDVLAPGVTAADPLIHDVDEVLASGPGAMNTGESCNVQGRDDAIWTRSGRLGA